MYCEKCGQQLPDHATFCGKCGSRVEDNGEPFIVQSGDESGEDSGFGNGNNKVHKRKHEWKWKLTGRMKLVIGAVVSIIVICGMILQVRQMISSYVKRIDIELNDRDQIVSADFHYSDNPNEDMQWDFDYTSDGELCDAVWNNANTENILDSNGNVIRRLEYNYNRNRIEREITYDSNGEPTDIKEYNSDGTIKRETAYDSKGNAIDRKTYDENGDLEYHTVYTYNSDNVVTDTREYDSQGMLVYQAQYDDRGNAVYYSKFFEAGETLYSYLTGGYLKEDGSWAYVKAEEDCFKEYTYVNTYNENGTIARIETYDADGYLYCSRDYTYQDEDSRLCIRIEKTNTSDIEDDPVREIEQYSFDDYGNIILWKKEYVFNNLTRYKETQYDYSYSDNVITRKSKSQNSDWGNPSEYIFDHNGGMIEKELASDGRIYSISKYQGVDYLKIPYSQSVSRPSSGVDPVVINQGIMIEEISYGYSDGELSKMSLSKYDADGNNVREISASAEGNSGSYEWYNSVTPSLLLSGSCSTSSSDEYIFKVYAKGSYDEESNELTFNWLYDKNDNIIGREKQEYYGTKGTEKYICRAEDDKHYSIYIYDYNAVSDKIAYFLADTFRIHRNNEVIRCDEEWTVKVELSGENESVTTVAGGAAVDQEEQSNEEIPASEEEKNENFTEDINESLIGDVSEGDIITFGTYEQDNDLTNGAEPLEWIVLKSLNGRMLLLSRYVIDCKPYHEEDCDITWAECDLRNWLNSTFYESAFNEEQQRQIIETEVLNPDNEDYGTPGGETTCDKVFLLSLDEFDNSVRERAAKATTYAMDSGLGTDDENYADWWLRSPGVYSNCAARVYYFGTRGDGEGWYVNSTDIGVRPAIRVILDE